MTTIIDCGAKTLPRDIDITIQLSKAQTELATDLSVVVFVSATGDLPAGAGRIRYYSSADALQADWPFGTQAYLAGRDFFAQSPRAKTLAVAQAFDTAQAGYLRTSRVNTDVAAWRAITDGSFSIAIDGVSETLTGLDFSQTSDMAAVLSLIQTALRAVASGGFSQASLKLDGTRLQITSGTLGEGAAVSTLGSANSGTDLSGEALLNGREGTITPGYTPSGLLDELMLIAEAARCSGRFVYGWALDEAFRDTPEAAEVGRWMEARKGVLALTSNSPLTLDAASSNDIASRTREAGLSRTTVTYHDKVAFYPEVSLLARMLGVNYALPQAVITAKFKDLPGIPTVGLDQTELGILERKRANSLVAVGNNARTYRNGTMASPSWFIDSRVGLDNLVEELQTAAFNVFLRNDVVPFTPAGSTLLVDGLTPTLERYVRNGLLADRPVLDPSNQSGIGLITAYRLTVTGIQEMSDSDRAGRIGPPVRVDVNLAGAQHSLAIHINAFE